MFETFSSLQQVSETSPRRLRVLLETEETSQRRLQQVSETSRRRLRDLLETGKSLPPKKNRTCLNFPRLPGDPASLQETSRRRRGDVSATSGDSSRQANEIGPQLPETSPRRPRDLRAIWLSPLETSPRSRLGESACKPYFGLPSRPSCRDWSVAAVAATSPPVR